MHKLSFDTFGIVGKAGSGKTSTVSMLCGGATNKREKIDSCIIDWDQIAFASPIKEIIAIKSGFPGAEMEDRRLYQIHGIISNVYNNSPLYGAPPYKKLVKLVKTIDSMDLGSADDNYRTFQQQLGDYVRKYDNDAFAKAAFNKAILKASDVKSTAWEMETQDLDYRRILVISDLRFDNEAELIKNKMGGKIIYFDCDEETRKQRLLERDGAYISQENAKHISEKGIKKKYIDYKLDTSKMDQQEVLENVKNFILKEIEI